ncbi:MAG: glutamine--fructose-6-phosphate transaminase (isomerizing) [Oscillospiraceae bacterium]|jgi:glucosamine--fructose-6-phosphate aminotransferase (isomerizing)|nr:glutamine--fructose-6-phosphate transaminase (isomerizing) [Oscillospiraceae bacterium]
MCGIVGYCGDEQAAPILLRGLERLEYRGYDSAGLCVETDGKLVTIKASGKLKNLAALTNDGKAINGVCGIGHTRWATHGIPTDTNAHPHLSDGERIAVVHNGIIENFRELRAFLENRGVTFRSDTDTEAAAQLIDYYYDGNLIGAVQKAVSQLEGSYALGIICRDFPDTLIAVKKSSPLIVAHTGGGSAGYASFLASDVTAILKYTRDMTYLEDGDMAVLTRRGIKFYDAYGQQIEKTVTRIDWDADAAQKGGYAHFMLKEIYEQPRVIRDTISSRINGMTVDLSDAGITPDYFDSFDEIKILACGTAYYAGVAGKYWLEQLARIPTEVIVASEFRYADPIIGKRTLAVILSQSGETADSHEALREAKRLGAKSLGIINVRGSAITRECDNTLYINAGPEIAVASTKAYTALLAGLYLLAAAAGQKRGAISPERLSAIIGELESLPDKLEYSLKTCAEAAQYAASQYFNHSSVFYIGRNLDYAAALEAAHKLKEISYIHAETYAGGELKHGTISLIEPGTLIVAPAAYEPLTAKLRSNIDEVKARGAEILCVTQEHMAENLKSVSDYMITIPDCDATISPFLTAVPLQLFAYYAALMRGENIDQPRNLAKVVTVE